MTAGVDNPGGLGYHTNRKGAAASGWPGHWIKLSKSRQPSPCGVAVVLFDTYGHDKAAPVKRNSKGHMHPLPEAAANRLRSMQRRYQNITFSNRLQAPGPANGRGLSKDNRHRAGWRLSFCPRAGTGRIFSHGGLVPFPSPEKVPKGRRGARPLENPECFVYLPFAAAGLILPKYLPFVCRCLSSTHESYR